MARWLVTQNETQFAVGSVAELRDLARAGRLGPADLVQPPNGTEWVYASEIPELKQVLGSGKGDDDDDLDIPRRSRSLQPVLAALLVLVTIAGAALAWQFASRMPDPNKRLIGDGGLSYSEMLVTGAGQSLLEEPKAGAKPLTSVDKDAVLELLAKRGDFYKARPRGGGAEGWIPTDMVMPMYLLGGGDVIKAYDPLYNPDRYLEVSNAGWLQLPEQRADRVTVFQFQLQNKSRFDMTDVVIVATIKDGKGHELERVEFAIEGVVPAEDRTTVGTLTDPSTKERRLVTASSFQAMAAEDPDLRLQFTEGAEVQMATEGFSDAAVDIVELRAVPDPA